MRWCSEHGGATRPAEKDQINGRKERAHTFPPDEREGPIVTIRITNKPSTPHTRSNLTYTNLYLWITSHTHNDLLQLLIYVYSHFEEVHPLVRIGQGALDMSSSIGNSWGVGGAGWVLPIPEEPTDIWGVWIRGGRSFISLSLRATNTQGRATRAIHHSPYAIPPFHISHYYFMLIAIYTCITRRYSVAWAWLYSSSREVCANSIVDK